MLMLMLAAEASTNTVSDASEKSNSIRCDILEIKGPNRCGATPWTVHRIESNRCIPIRVQV